MKWCAMLNAERFVRFLNSLSTNYQARQALHCTAMQSNAPVVDSSGYISSEASLGMVSRMALGRPLLLPGSGGVGICGALSVASCDSRPLCRLTGEMEGCCSSDGARRCRRAAAKGLSSFGDGSGRGTLERRLSAEVAGGVLCGGIASGGFIPGSGSLMH